MCRGVLLYALRKDPLTLILSPRGEEGHWMIVGQKKRATIDDRRAMDFVIYLLLLALVIRDGLVQGISS